MEQAPDRLRAPMEILRACAEAIDLMAEYARQGSPLGPKRRGRGGRPAERARFRPPR